jgi:hypothetical protein
VAHLLVGCATEFSNSMAHLLTRCATECFDLDKTVEAFLTLPALSFSRFPSRRTLASTTPRRTLASLRSNSTPRAAVSSSAGREVSPVLSAGETTASARRFLLPPSVKYRRSSARLDQGRPQREIPLHSVSSSAARKVCRLDLSTNVLLVCLCF